MVAITWDEYSSIVVLSRPVIVGLLAGDNLLSIGWITVFT